VFSLESLKQFLKAKGIHRFFFKKLAENDNAKNQIYLGGSFEVIQNIPFADIYMEQGLKKPTYKAKLDFWWIGENGNTAVAPNAQLIMYPKYPEVRLSDFLRGCALAPSEFFREIPQNIRTGEADGRYLVLAPSGKQIFAYLAKPDSQLSAELSAIKYDGILGTVETDNVDVKKELISLLSDAYATNPHELVRMYTDGSIHPYTGRNAGGYTLEAFFGIIPNGNPLPDYKGWELKSLSGSAVTLMTPNLMEENITNLEMMRL